MHFTINTPAPRDEHLATVTGFPEAVVCAEALANGYGRTEIRRERNANIEVQAKTWTEWREYRNELSAAFGTNATLVEPRA